MPIPPNITSHQEMLVQWASTLEQALLTMLVDERTGKLVDDTLERDFEFVRHLMGRREIIVNEIRLAGSRHRGPGMPGYRELGGGTTTDAGTSSDPTLRVDPPPHLVRDGTRREALGARETDYQGEAFGKEAGSGVDH